MRPFCVKCQLELVCLKTGAIAVAMSMNGPAESRSCDIFTCPACGTEIAVGFAAKSYHVGPGIVAKLSELLERGARLVAFWGNRLEKRKFKAAQRPLAIEDLEPNDAGLEEPKLEELMR